LRSQPGADFDSLLEKLVELGTRLTSAVDQDNRELAERLSGESRTVLEELQQSIRDPEDKALHLMTGLDPATVDRSSRVRRRVLVLLVTRGLERRYREGRATGSQRRLDAFVLAMLPSLPLGEKLAQELGANLLVGSPYVGLLHEEAVLDLVAMSAEQLFLRGISAELLLTLWNNLHESGARSGSELASLALLFKDDANTSKRLAALTHLLTAQDGRYRDLTLDEICSRRERGMARDLGLAAARILDPRDALAVLQQLATVTTEGMTSAFVTLGQRDPQVLRTTYESKLADNMEPGLRAELITGSGFSRTVDGVELAQLAFRADPDPAVRTRAMFVLTANARQNVGEEVLTSALDDAEYSGDPRRLGEIVVALENLASKGITNAVRSLGTRLMSRADLLPGDRERLAKLLSR
jgi:hypothetical protein